MDNEELFSFGLLLFGVGIILSHIIELVQEMDVFAGLMVAGGAGMIIVTTRMLATGDVPYDKPADVWTYLLIGGSLLVIAGGALRIIPLL